MFQHLRMIEFQSPIISMMKSQVWTMTKRFGARLSAWRLACRRQCWYCYLPCALNSYHDVHLETLLPIELQQDLEFSYGVAKNYWLQVITYRCLPEDLQQDPAFARTAVQLYVFPYEVLAAVPALPRIARYGRKSLSQLHLII